MHTQNPMMDEFARITTAFMGLAQAAGDEAKTAFRAQAEKFIADFDLVRRDEFEAMKAELAALRAQVEAQNTAAKPAAKARPAPRKPAAPEV